jgi:hypothetical protein
MGEYPGSGIEFAAKGIIVELELINLGPPIIARLIGLDVI